MLKTTLFLVLILHFAEGRCQKRFVKTLDSISKAIAKNLSANDGEQAYLTTNKSVYASGEPVWFRAFLLRSVSNKISTRSQTLFVDVVDKEDKAVATVLLNARAQQTSGSLSLPDSLPSGNYWIRAYTRTMIAADPEKAAVVPLYFFNPQTPDTVLNTANREVQSLPPSIHFYAEGGTLAMGQYSTIALRITDKDGRPIQINGYLKDSSNGIVSAFSTNTQGLCKITFSPGRNRKYWSEIVWKGRVIRYDLPSFDFYTGQVSVSRNAYRDFVVRTVLADSIYPKDAPTYLIGVSRGIVCFAAVSRGQYELEVPEQNFPKGIATFLLLDTNGKLLSERSVYVKAESPAFRLGLDKTTYSKREEVNLKTSVLDDKAVPVSSSLTVSVADNNALAFGAINHRLINQILEGREDNWSLAHLSSQTEEETDLIMLCVSDRFKKMTAAKPTGAAETDSLLYISGTVTSNKRPVSQKPVMLLSATPLTVLLMDTTDAMGRFCFPLEAYPDSTRFALQIGKASTWDKSLRLVVDSLHFPKFHTPLALKKSLDINAPEVKPYFVHFADTTLRVAKKEVLKEVVVKTAKVPFEKQRVSFMSRIVTSDELIERGRVTLGDAFLGRSDVHVLSGKYSILIVDGNVFPFGNDLELTSGGPGGTAVSDVKNGGNRPRANAETTPNSEVIENLDFSPLYYFLNTLPIKDIDFIEILSPMVALEYGPRGQFGGIYIHTKAADGIYSEGGLRMFYAKGYIKEADFPLVNYQSKAADRRSTLFWMGNALNDATGYCNADFYTNDVPGVYTVTASGITKQGDILFDSTTFKIK